MTVDDAIRDFASQAKASPQDAVQWAVENWDQARPRFLALLTDYSAGTDMSVQTEQALFAILHLLAEKREVGAFAPLCRLLGDAETANLLLGDAITETLSGS